MSMKQQSRAVELVFRYLCIGCAVIMMLLLAGFLVQLFLQSLEALSKFGLGFLWSSDWDQARDEFGALPSLYGTFVTTMIALVVAVPASFLIAMCLVEVSHPTLSRPMSQAVDLLAAVPSIIYGMWGLFVLVPIMETTVQPFLANTLGLSVLTLFSEPDKSGINLFTAGVVLAVMILPYMTAIMRDTFRMVPSVVKESAYGSGATTWEVTRDITMRYGMQGMLGAFFLGLGRAIGETMAVLFIIGNVNEIPGSLFNAGATIASTLANNFGEAEDGKMLRPVLFLLAFVLLLVTLVIQLLAQWWLSHVKKKTGGGL